jgi:endonuclease YncB( thermonuclease family)
MKIKWLYESIVAACCVLLAVLIIEKVKDDQATGFSGHYRIVDGDSLAQGRVRFRLAGIDAPELKQTCTRDKAAWHCGEAARQALDGLVGGAVLDCKGGRKDKYQRLLVTCFKDGTDLNREMVVRGMALSYGAYESEEAAASRAHNGLWASDFVRPADWRRRQKAGMEEEPAGPSWLSRLFGGGEG